MTDLFQQLKAKRVKPQPVAPAADNRMKDEDFKQAVRDVLTFLGVTPDFGNFKKYDRLHGSPTPIAWLEFAHNLKDKSRWARAWPIDCNGWHVADDIPMKIPGGDVANLESGYEFKCWDSETF
ncbi:MAG: hypothetical protein KAJ19_03270 [Gammaproteobacteria bacterium]|nr:hypothetical protein [Gammaproteobacteria bacterium]